MGKRKGAGAKAERAVATWELTSEDLVEFQHMSTEEFKQAVGSPESLAEKLRTSITNGLEEDEEELNRRADVFGTNVPPEKEYTSFFGLVLEALNDATLIILVMAAVVSLLLGLLVREDENRDGVEDKNTGWIEGAAILMAVVIVSLVTATNNYSKEKQFRELNRIKENHKTRVLRKGNVENIGSFSILVGDIVVLDTGDAIPADGIMLEAYDFSVDQSAMTGESHAVTKSASDPFVMAGTRVMEGVGRMLVTCVGCNSEWGRTMALLQEDVDDTPLQQKLETVAATIGWIGLGTALLTFAAQAVHWFYDVYLSLPADTLFPWSLFFKDMTDYLIQGVTIVVVAVPEGLPLAVTISLAYSMKKMMKDNNLVRKLEACETMGGATDVCSDKTGTLTQNRMTVVEGWIAGNDYAEIDYKKELELQHSMSKQVYSVMCENIGINSTAHITVDGSFCGSQTECALLQFAQKSFNYEYITSRATANILRLQNFNSERKCMSVLVQSSFLKSHVIYTKGASEVILSKCTHVMQEDGSSVPLKANIRQALEQRIHKMSDNALRVLCLAMRPVSDREADEISASHEPMEEGLTCIGLIGIIDPLRHEVKDAVRQCFSAGLNVRMVTGDNLNTAVAIAKQAGILREGGIAMEGKDFRKLSKEKMEEAMGSLQVLARSTPKDKYVLVETLKNMGAVVAVTGDGTNDSAALRKADVGLAMGLCGTEVAKEASDIVLLDDNFASIVKAIIWGRCVYDNIRKFLQFQLTVNLVALTTAFVSAIMEFGTPLTAVQLLWVNLIMDSFAALALATEPPSEELLKRKPYGRDDAMISGIMWRNIICQAIFQLCVQFVILMWVPEYWGIVPHSRVHHTISFNAFVFCQIFNEFNSRRLENRNDVFSGFTNNHLFTGIIFVTVIVQILFVQVGGSFTQCAALSLSQWMFCVLAGSLSIPFGFIYRSFSFKDDGGSEHQKTE